MAGAEIEGGHPQSPALRAPGVSLAHPEQDFLNALIDLTAHIGEPGYPKTASCAPPELQLSSNDPFSLTVPDNYTDPKKRHRPHTLVELYALGEKAGLRQIDVNYLREWIVCQGIHWLTCTDAGIDDDLEGKRVFRNPVVRRIINAAAERGLCTGTTASKEEIADWYTQRIRNPLLDTEVRVSAADKLAKLMGYYPDVTAKGGGSANIQINFINPYASQKVVEAEVVDA